MQAKPAQESKSSSREWLLGNKNTMCLNVTPLSLLPLPPPFFITQYNILWHEIPLSLIWTNSPGCVPYQLLAHPLTLEGHHEKEKRPWCYVSSAQRCVINIVLITYTKYSTMRTTMKKVNSIPVKISILFLKIENLGHHYFRNGQISKNFSQRLHVLIKTTEKFDITVSSASICTVAFSKRSPHNFQGSS